MDSLIGVREVSQRAVGADIAVGGLGTVHQHIHVVFGTGDEPVFHPIAAEQLAGRVGERTSAEVIFLPEVLVAGFGTLEKYIQAVAQLVLVPVGLRRLRLCREPVHRGNEPEFAGPLQSVFLHAGCQE